MEFGVTFPQTAIGTDPTEIAAFARETEALGYRHVLAYDHVLGANPETQDFRGIYDYTDQFHEPLTLFSYLAAETDRIELVPGVLVVPMRQTALVAKQTAEVDLLSDGRLKLGVGIGSNRVEYEAMGVEMADRGARIEEGVELLRRLWTQELVDFDGRFHRIPDAGINPRPVQRPIPVWFGGGADTVLRRIARMGDGWIPMSTAPDTVAEKIDRLREYCRDADRSFDDLTVIYIMNLETRDPERWRERIRTVLSPDVSRVSVTTLRLDLPEPADHREVIAAFRDAVEAVGGTT